MRLTKKQRQQFVSWAFVGAVAVLSVSLGLLQYRWIGEVSRAERERLKGSLQTSLNRLSREFNSELTSACTSILPDRPMPDAQARRQEYAAHFTQLAESNRNARTFRNLFMVAPQSGAVELLQYDWSNEGWKKIAWPPDWDDARQRALARISGDPRARRGALFEDQPNLIEMPLFDQRMGGRDAAPLMPGPAREIEWLVFDLNTEYLAKTVIPQMLQRHLGDTGISDYQAEIAPVGDGPSKLIYSSDGSSRPRIGDKADASVHLMDVRMDMVFRRFAGMRGFDADGRGGGRRRGPGDPASPFTGADRGRWVLSVRHHAGSLDAVVEQARTRNLIVTTSILFLMMAALWALVRYTRRAQQLAELQMEFVAGVSHELRTPLSVMKTAGHNLQGRISNDPTRVQRYGALIQEQSEKLGAIVEQVLRFANAQADRVIGAKEPVAVESVIQDALSADKQVIEQSNCVVERNIEPDLPMILADPNSLKHAVQNLVSNAAKYGKDGAWIGISAVAHKNGGSPEVEIRIADHGPGIPADELNQIFNPFYRGKKAIQDQVHGTGLGLSLAKRIVEAHHGTLSVRSEEGKGTEFTIRIPAAAVEQENELANSIG